MSTTTQTLRRSTLTALLSVALVGFAPAALAQNAPNTQNTRPPDQMMLELAVSGQLKSVDPDAKKLVVTTKEGADVEFSYDQSTRYSGETVEGLANSSGTQVRVFYREENGQKIATQIEVREQPENEKGTEKETQPAPEPPQAPQPPQPPQEPGQQPPGA